MKGNSTPVKAKHSFHRRNGQRALMWPKSAEPSRSRLSFAEVGYSSFCRRHSWLSAYRCSLHVL